MKHALRLFLIIGEYENYTTGELAVMFNLDHEELKEVMRGSERLGLGQFGIQDGMYFFWLSEKGKRAYDMLRSLEIG